MKFGSKKGFTLIELLVVVAIIGILSSIVLASLNTARRKGQDASAKGSMSSARAAAELYFDNYGDYGDSGGAVTIAEGDAGSGVLLDAIPNDICEYSEVVNLLAAVANQVDEDATCETTIAPAAYTLHATLNDDRVYCVDSSGFAGYLADGDTTPISPGAGCAY